MLKYFSPFIFELNKQFIENTGKVVNILEDKDTDTRMHCQYITLKHNNILI